MSWLARSIANTLRLDEEEEDDGDTKNAVNPESPAQSPSTGADSPRGVKEDLSEISKTLSRQFWGVASFLAPPPSDPSSNQSELDRASDPEASEEAVLEGIRSDFAEIGGRFKTGISRISNNIPVSEITKFASNFLQFGSEEENYEIGNVVGVTEEVVAFARDIAMHPGTWLDFPIPDDHGDDFDDFDMSDAQQELALAVERLAPRLASLRLELCPGYMSEGCFWKIYFVLLHPRLNKHDAELLSTPQILEARTLLTQEVRTQAAANLTEEQPGSSTSRGTDFVPREEPLSVPSSTRSDSAPPKISGAEMAPIATAVEIETEKHPVQTTEIQVVDKSIIEEQPVNQTKFQYSYEKSDDEGDDWLKEETSETVGSSSTAIPIEHDEDVSFSDLEDDDDDDVPTSHKKVTSSSDSSTKDSRDWVQLRTSSGDSVKDVNCVGENPSGPEQVSSRNRERKESNDWLDIEEIM